MKKIIALTVLLTACGGSNGNGGTLDVDSPSSGSGAPGTTTAPVGVGDSPALPATSLAPIPARRDVGDDDLPQCEPVGHQCTLVTTCCDGVWCNFGDGGDANYYGTCMPFPHAQ
jgi:hypothetical protein